MKKEKNLEDNINEECGCGGCACDSKPAGETVAEEAKTEIKKSELELRYDELNEKYVRLFAEYDNFRRRSAKEKDDLYQESISAVATAFLPMADALTKAVEIEPGDAGAVALQKQLIDIFAKINITEIESDNAVFDPELHNAIMHETDESLPESTVVQTFQKGYRIGDKIIRHAMVKVVN